MYFFLCINLLDRFPILIDDPEHPKKKCGRKKIFFCQNEKISRREDFVLLQIVVLGQRRSKHDEYCSKAHFWMDRVMRITIFRAHRPELFSEWWSRKWHWQHPIHPETMFLNSILYSSMPSTSWCPTVKKSKHSIERLFRSRRNKFFSSSFFIDRVNQNWKSTQQVYT